MTANNGSESKYVDFIHPTPYSWQRPEGPPCVWRIVKGRKETVDGEIPKFSIQEVPKELEDEVVEFMLKYLIVEEPIRCNLGIADNPLAVRELRTYWRNIVRQGVSVIALTVNSDPTAEPVLAGVNILVNVSVEDIAAIATTREQFQSEPNRKWLGVVAKLSQEAAAMKKYGLNRCLVGAGLSILPTLRGQGLGDQLIQARQDIGIAHAIPMSETFFSGLVSQILAARNGFEVMLEKDYSDILDDEGKVAFPGLTEKSGKIMARKLY